MIQTSLKTYEGKITETLFELPREIWSKNLFKKERERNLACYIEALHVLKCCKQGLYCDNIINSLFLLIDMNKLLLVSQKLSKLTDSRCYKGANGNVCVVGITTEFNEILVGRHALGIWLIGREMLRVTQNMRTKQGIKNGILFSNLEKPMMLQALFYKTLFSEFPIYTPNSNQKALMSLYG